MATTCGWWAPTGSRHHRLYSGHRCACRPSMQYFDSRGVHRVYAIGFDGRELTLERDAPGFAQRGSAKLSDDGSTLAGVWQLNEDNQGYHDDLAFTYQRASNN